MRFCYFADLIALDVNLLRVQIKCSEAYRIEISITLHTGRKFSLYVIKYLPHWKAFHVEDIDFN
jgi:hypothetical protein